MVLSVLDEHERAEVERKAGTGDLSALPITAVLEHLTDMQLKRMCTAIGVPATGRRRTLAQRVADREEWLGAARSTFVAIDFETADYGSDSACAVALVRVENLRIVGRAVRLIKPPRRNFMFTYIHGITWSQVQREPTFADVWRDLHPMLAGARFLAAHNASFDRRVLEACCLSAGHTVPTLPFRCTVQMARKTWNVRPTRLPDVCTHLGIPLRHHDAASDAEACARIVIEASHTLARVA